MIVCSAIFVQNSIQHDFIDDRDVMAWKRESEPFNMKTVKMR